MTNARGLNERFRKGQAAIVDIMPTLVSFLNIEIPREKMMEIDGVPLTGKLSATDLQVNLNEGILDIKWQPVTTKGKAKIWLTTTNHFKTGGHDDFRLLKEVAVSKGRAQINVQTMPSFFYKIVLEMPYTILNRWLVLNK